MNVRIFSTIATSVLLATLALACSPIWENRLNRTAQAQEEDTQIIYGEIVDASPEYIMIPVEVAGKQGLLSNDYSSEYRSKSSPVNMIFHSLKTGQSHLLLNKKAALAQWEFLELKKEKDKPAIKVLLLRLIESDTNGDKKFDLNDASVGYLADISGKNLRRITPVNAQLLGWKYDKNRDIIFLRVVKDSDNNKKFTSQDEVNFIKVSPNNPGQGKEIINDKIQQEIKSLIK
ncbi:hypothetical protein [Microseira wollei]|uniref:Lipoprotein n=1 Tax=Microseira wollei NIES-4236 TaxID=2530354 RepID=A0AAV3WNU3_9CYAN|nr:hypothetical protein [Microseira wollei]GET43539.1 hypothetical protein MiSe_83640 [Microseira wollei NIES-4236]